MVPPVRVVFLAANLVVAAGLVAVVVALWPDAPATTAGVGRRVEQVLPKAPSQR